MFKKIAIIFFAAIVCVVTILLIYTKDPTSDMRELFHQSFGEKTSDGEDTLLGLHFDEEYGNITVVGLVNGNSADDGVTKDAYDKLLSFYIKLQGRDFSKKYQGKLSVVMGAAQMEGDNTIFISSIETKNFKDIKWNQPTTYDEFLEKANIH